METRPLQEVECGTEKISQEPKSKSVKKGDTAFLVITVISGAMVTLYSGISLTWPSSAIPKMKSNNTEENPLGRTITTFEISMLAGLPTLAMLLGAIILGYLSKKVGRKRTMQTIGAGVFISTIFLAFSTNIYSIIIFRCLSAFFIHAGYTVYPIYLVEICEDHNKAKYGCLSGVFLPIGNLMGYGISPFLNFRNYNLAELSPLILFSVFFLLAPESPVYNLSKKKTEESIRALKMLRGNKSEKELETDLRKIDDSIKASRIINQRMTFLNLFNTKEARYGIMLSFLPLMVKIFCGMGIIMPFMEPIFIASETHFNSSYMPIIAASFKVLVFFVASLIVEKCGRKILLLISSVGSGVNLLALGWFFYLKIIKSPLIYQLHWIPLGSITCYGIFFSIGIGVIPQAVIGEVFTPDKRAEGVSFVMILFAIFLFCSSSTYIYIVEYIGFHWCFWLYGCLSLLGATFIYMIYPENKGKSVVEIQEYIKLRCNK